MKQAIEELNRAIVALGVTMQSNAPVSHIAMRFTKAKYALLDCFEAGCQDRYDKMTGIPTKLAKDVTGRVL